jgi:hypothetical protein
MKEEDAGTAVELKVWFLDGVDSPSSATATPATGAASVSAGQIAIKAARTMKLVHSGKKFVVSSCPTKDSRSRAAADG